jgi:TatD DNase family protein
LGDLDMNLVDAHCHLQDEAFNEDRDEVVRRARQAGVTSIITSSLSLVDASRILEIAERFRNYVYACIGLDPSNLELKEAEETRKLIETYEDLIVGIGEVGLDYYWVRKESDRELQKRLFQEWIELAQELHLPLVVHSRSAGKYAIQILLESGFRRVLMHAYDGRVGWAMKAAEEDVYFSIPTSVWHSRQKQKLAKALPLEHLTVESDAPVLSPIRGERNEPANLVYAVKKIAELKGLSEKEVAVTTTKNARKLFGL